MPENGDGRIFGMEGGGRSMNSKTVGNTKGCTDRSWSGSRMTESECTVEDRRNARKGITNIADMSSKTDQVSGTEKVLALYPTINRLNMGELVVSKNQSTRWVKLGSG